MSNKLTKAPPKRSREGKRGRMFTFVGASIVLVTFVVKDGLKERLKDLSDSIVATESVQGIEQGIETLGLQQLTLQMNLQALANTLTLQNQGKIDYVAQMRTDSMLLQELESETDVAYERMSRLIDALPRSAEIQAQAAGFKTKVDELKKKIQQQRATLAKQTPSATNDVQLKLDLAEIAVSELPIVFFEDAAITKAKEVREAYEKLYGLCRWASYFLYFIGWCLALYGRLQGFEGFPAD